MAQSTDGEARRAYWREQMEAAAAFMDAVLGDPIAECGEPLAALPEAVAAAGVDVAFVDRPHVLGLPRLFYLRAGLVPAFLAVARAMNERGWMLKVEDAYRTVTMQKHQAQRQDVFDVVLERVRWECGGAEPEPALVARRLAALVAANAKVGTHMAGSAVDVTVLDRASGAELDRGGPYVTLSEATPMASPFISPEGRRNRDAITAVFAEHGFVAYPWEFWHYSAGDVYAERLRPTGRPARYGPVHASLPDGAVTPIEHPETPLNSLDELSRRRRETGAG